MTAMIRTTERRSDGVETTYEVEGDTVENCAKGMISLWVARDESEERKERRAALSVTEADFEDIDG